MKKQPFLTVVFAGINLTSFGFQIPSPVVSLNMENSEQTATTSWTLNITVSGADTKKSNIAAFEALLYSSAQAAHSVPNSKGIPVQFMFGWLDEFGNVAESLSYNGWCLTYSVSTNGLYMNYKITGLCELDPQKHIPVIRIPSLCGVVQPSAVVEAFCKATKADSYYLLDIDHNDAPTLVEHGPLTTSFNLYVRGSYSSIAYSDTDNYSNFPGLLKYSKSYNASREAAGLKNGYRKLSQLRNNLIVSPLENYLKPSNTDTTPQCSSFSFWIDEPTMTSPGIIHYKSNANLLNKYSKAILEYGTANTNVFTISGNYNGVAYNMTNLNFKQVGFTLDVSGNSIEQPYELVNSWSSSLADVFRTADIINDVNALATQFSGDFTVQIPGTVTTYSVMQPVSLLVMSGNTLSPITGVYNIVSVSHAISNTFITTLKLQRTTISTANEVASSMNILVDSNSMYGNNSLHTTKNIKNAYTVDFGELYPNFEHIDGGMSLVS